MTLHLQPAPGHCHLPTHPGEHLAAWLVDHDRTLSDIADTGGIDLRRIEAVLTGRDRIHPDTADALARATDVPLELWVDLQDTFDADTAD